MSYHLDKRHTGCRPCTELAQDATVYAQVMGSPYTTMTSGIHQAVATAPESTMPVRECEFCTPVAARECRDPQCRAAGYGEPTAQQ